MSNVFDGLDFTESKSDSMIFYEWRGRQIALRERYTAAACKSCGKFDAYECASLGFDEDVTHAFRIRGGLVTRDSQCVIGVDAYKRLKQVCGELLTFVDIGHGACKLAFPSNRVYPTRRNEPPFEMHGPKCRKCGRFSETTIDASKVCLDGSRSLVGFCNDSTPFGCMNISWICSRELVDRLKLFKIPGIRFYSGLYGTESKKALKLKTIREDPNSMLNRILRGEL